MKRVLLAATILAAIWATTQAKADLIDPLHMFCTDCAGDQGNFNPFPVGQPPQGITVLTSGSNNNGGATGDFILKVLIPIDSQVIPGTTTDSVTGTLGNNPNFSSSVNIVKSPITGADFFIPGNNGQNNPSLEQDFLGITTSTPNPPNRLQTFLAQTTTQPGGDPSAIGYVVLTLDLGNLTVPEQNFGSSPFSLSLGNALPGGSWVLGDVVSCTGTGTSKVCTDVTTATSNALFATQVSVPGPIVGAGLPGLVSALLGMIGLNRYRKRRSLA
jgi:hypothetical protein